jgi:Fur family ferric uptake transcriptional regulator
VADIKELLVRSGLRRTGPRMTLLTILQQSATHLSVPELYRRAADIQPTINTSTVYRNVAAMTEFGILHSIDYAGEVLFGLDATPHNHLICEQCGLLVEVPANELDPITVHLGGQLDFDPDPAGQVLRGRCRGCARRPAETSGAEAVSLSMIKSRWISISSTRPSRS